MERGTRGQPSRSCSPWCVAAGDYSQRLPVVQDDDLGALAASFNRMQAGLAERQRLQAAFGTYVDPALAARLLEQGDDVFTGERRQVTVMFVDIRDFTPFADANTAEDTVARLNALFEIVVPAVVDAGGHVNKFLGDGSTPGRNRLRILDNRDGGRRKAGRRGRARPPPPSLQGKNSKGPYSPRNGALALVDDYGASLYRPPGSVRIFTQPLGPHPTRRE
jgi:HAMP domain/Adenylate and Guanylate cyclase catalytic domain